MNKWVFISANPGRIQTFEGCVWRQLSRLMLAIRVLFRARPALFDEVDTGASGRVAQAIAQKIHKIGSNGQVLAISHLPQVIAIADYQFFTRRFLLEFDRSQRFAC